MVIETSAGVHGSSGEAGGADVADLAAASAGATALGFTVVATVFEGDEEELAAVARRVARDFFVGTKAGKVTGGPAASWRA